MPLHEDHGEYTTSLALMRIRAYGSKAFQNKFMWCFDKAKLVNLVKLLERKEAFAFISYENVFYESIPW